MFDYFKFRLHRRWRRARRNSRIYRAWLVNYFYRHVWGKWRQLGIIRRFIMVWWGIALVCLVLLLNQNRGLQQFYLFRAPLPGGVYSEAVVGSVKTINPILPDSASSVDVARLVFSGLTRLKPDGTLEPELAESWQVSDDGLKYTFKLRKDLKWQDGIKLTASDVVFTVTAIQHPDSRSPLAADWKGVKAFASDEHTVVFTLPNPYIGFVYLTTVGVLPRHSLEAIDPATLRANDFNQRPIGTGPFKVKNFTPGVAAVMEANPGYWRGRPKLDGFTLRFYRSSDEALSAYSKRQVNAVGRVESYQLEDAGKAKNIKLLRYGTTEQTALFLKTTTAPLNDPKVRQALMYATDRLGLVSRTLHDQVQPSNEALLPGQIGYNGRYGEPRRDLARAKTLLDEAGWKTEGGVRLKGDQALRLQLVTLDDSRLKSVAEEIKQQWQLVGADVEITAVNFEELIQSHIKARQYQVLLYGISLGVDGDIYPYWHSSQANNPGLNLSQYKSSTADAALEVGRIVSDKEIRAGKYQAFLKAFRDDVPAIPLYADDYFYGVSGQALGITPGVLAQPADRFYGVENWTIRTKPTLIK